MGSAEETLTWAIRFSDADENEISPQLVEFDTEQTSSAAKAYPADRDALALPKMPPVNAAVNERGKVILEALGSAADTIESEECGGKVPVVLTNKRTGVKNRTTLNIGDTGQRTFSGFDSTDDIVLNTSNFVRVGAYQVPDGFMLKLDAGRPVHAYFGDDT